jgi:heat shock protein HtpX
MINVYESVDSNKTKSWIIITFFMIFVTVAAYIISYALTGGDQSALIIALTISTLMTVGSYYFSDKIVLATSGAHPADKKEYFNFYTVVENLAMSQQMPMPRLYVIDDSAPNAFATGRDPDHAVICATTGILEKLDRTELEGVFAHELSHVKNYDVRLMTVTAVMVGMLTLLGDMFFRSMWLGGGRKNRDSEGGNIQMIFFVVGLLFAILSPIIGRLIQLAISRRREFLADASGALMTRYPEGLARALEKISADREPLEAANRATAHMYIISPFRAGVQGEQGKINWLTKMFMTHPPVEERIRALRSV